MADDILRISLLSRHPFSEYGHLSTSRQFVTHAQGWKPDLPDPLKRLLAQRHAEYDQAMMSTGQFVSLLCGYSRGLILIDVNIPEQLAPSLAHQSVRHLPRELLRLLHRRHIRSQSKDDGAHGTESNHSKPLEEKRVRACIRHSNDIMAYLVVLNKLSDNAALEQLRIHQVPDYRKVSVMELTDARLCWTLEFLAWLSMQPLDRVYTGHRVLLAWHVLLYCRSLYQLVFCNHMNADSDHDIDDNGDWPYFYEAVDGLLRGLGPMPALLRGCTLHRVTPPSNFTIGLLHGFRVDSLYLWQIPTFYVPKSIEAPKSEEEGDHVLTWFVDRQTGYASVNLIAAPQSVQRQGLQPLVQLLLDRLAQL
jgi:hypothetical protein